MRYEDFSRQTRPELQASLTSQDPVRIRDALLSAIYYEPDWHWLQDVCFQFIGHQDPRVRLAAAECFGELARSRGAPLDFERIVPALEALANDSEMGFAAREAMDDINFVLGQK